MVEITNLDERCFAKIGDGCAIKNGVINCSPKCPFYKPRGCEDWVRRETKYEILLIPPEDYEKERENEQNLFKQNQLYWHIKNVPAGKGRLR